MDLLYYDIDEKVEAFSTRKGSSLPYNVIQPHQIHGDAIAIIKDPNIEREKLRGIDALITNLENCAIAVRSADCVPLLLYDSVCNVIAAVHSGWRGTVKKISQAVIREMHNQLGTNAKDLKVIIGPSIGPESFFVKQDVVTEFNKAGFPTNKVCVSSAKDTYTIDLWAANVWLLQEFGVQKENIKVTGICSYIHHDEFYSARYEKDNKCERTINVIKIKDIKV